MEKTFLPGTPPPTLNALKNGFDALDYIYLSRLHATERGIVDELRDALYEYYDPQDLVETLIVDRIVMNYFRLHRLYLLEHHAFDLSLIHAPSRQDALPNLDRFSRYDSRISHQLTSLHQTYQKARRSRELTHQFSHDENLTSK